MRQTGLVVRDYDFDDYNDYRTLSDDKKRRLLAYMNMLQNTKE